jgi:hypothetical protein
VKLRERRSSDALTTDELRARASENRSIVAWLMGFWLVALIGFALWLKITYEIRGDLNCPVPGMDSTYGKSSWQWLPPGEVCAYPGTGLPTAYPSVFGAILGFGLVGFPFVVVPLWLWSEARFRNRLGSAV